MLPWPSAVTILLNTFSRTPIGRYQLFGSPSRYLVILKYINSPGIRTTAYIQGLSYLVYLFVCSPNGGKKFCFQLRKYKIFKFVMPISSTNFTLIRLGKYNPQLNGNDFYALLCWIYHFSSPSFVYFYQYFVIRNLLIQTLGVLIPDRFGLCESYHSIRPIALVLTTG